MRCLDWSCRPWRQRTIFEAGAGGALTAALARSAATHIPSQLLPDLERGAERRGIRSEDLEKLTLGDASVDIVITEDVFEHVRHPARAFAEVGRILRSGGLHVFTVPYNGAADSTVVRATFADDGVVTHLLEPAYHGDPLSARGVLVVSDFGRDLASTVHEAAGMHTIRVDVCDPRAGILEPTPVFISQR